ncbi:MAG: hypothetical protein IJP25_04130 [Elusimicrobiaceae bacterium]|nr:hypothetical protein [Elusimicrobiaceae bacterium]
MRKILFVLCVALFLTACATSYKPAKKITGKGYFDSVLQENVYDIVFNANSETSLKKTKDYALLRAAEVCLEKGYKTFSIINTENNSKTDIDVVNGQATYTTGYTYSYGYVDASTSPSINIVIRCSYENDLFFNAEDIKKNIRDRYKIK